MTVLGLVPRAQPGTKAVIFSKLFFPDIQIYKGLALTLKTVLTNAVPANATNAERKLKKRALGALKPDLTRIPKSPIWQKRTQTISVRILS
jgi:hypothetical protein